MVYTCKGCPADYSFYKDKTYAECDDTVQGQVDNCSFIASLISVAWVTGFYSSAFTPARPSPRGFKTENGTDKYWIQFFTGYHVADPNEFWISEQFFLDENNTFKYAHSFETGELWSAVYEKAYGNYSGKGDVCDMATLVWPPFTTPPLVALTGWAVRPNKLTTGRTSDTIYAEIAGRCTTKKTTRPMIAWTKAGCPTDAQMIPNHAYSVLGIHTDANNNRFIVLRNPKGLMAGANNAFALLDPVIWTGVGDILYNEGGNQLAGPGVRNISFNRTIGLFALPIDKFVLYFTAYTWVGRA